MSQSLLLFDEPSENRWVLCGNISEVTEGRGLALEVQGVRLAVFYVDGQLDILEGRCPHANAPLGRGWLDGTLVVCPLHRWKFDVRTGECRTNPQKSVRHFQSRIDDKGLIWVDLSGVETLNDSAGFKSPQELG